MGTEEDGVDEAGSTTQSPFITTPQLLDSDPDADSDGAVIDNSSMSSSRTRSGSSRSGSTGAGASRTQATPRADANGTTAKDNAKSEAVAEPDSEAAKPAKQPKAAPMPADGIGSRPSFTPAGAASPSPSSSPSTPSPSPSTQSSSYSQSSNYSQSSSYPQSSSSYSSPNYSRSSWSSTPDPTATVAADSAGFGSSGGTNGTRSGPSGGGFSATAAGAAAGLSGAAAGLASSVTAAFRGGSGPKAKSATAPKIKVRRSSKRQAMLTLSRVEPWSVMKFSFVSSVVAFIILFVAVAVLYMVLSALGVFTSLENQVASITSAKNTAGTNISHWFSASLILGYTAMLGALNIVLITAMCTVGSVIYNLIAKTVGGIEVTLRETD